MVGRTVGKYMITAKLGEGGMGSIWRADDPLLARSVAIKFLSERLADSPQARRRFLREARTASSLQHPGIATLYDAGELDDGNLYFATEYIDGETVAARIADGPLELREALRVAADAAEALDYAHGQGLFHRDISARNIMVARSGRVVLIDFGLARHGDSTGLTSSDATLGTIAYLAPEVLSGSSASVRSDLYSLAVVLYEMLTGLHPFPGDRMGYRAVNEKPAPPSTRRRGLDPALDRLVLKAMAKNPEQRFRSAGEFSEKLLALSVLEPSREKIRTPGFRAKRTRRRLAVRPFEGVTSMGGGDAEADRIALALSASLGAALARHPELSILPWADSAERDAIWVLAGTVRRNGERVRVDYTIGPRRRGKALAGQVDGTTPDLFALEDELLASVVRALGLGRSRSRRAGSDPAGAQERYLVALGYLRRNDTEATIDGAVKILEELVEREGDTAQFHAALGTAYLQKSRLSLQTEWLDKAEHSCRLALELEPHSPEVLLTLGRLLLRTGKYGEALASFEKSLSAHPESHDALILKSRALQLMGRFGEAEEAAKAGVALRSDYWLGHQRLGMIYFQQGQYERAIQEWERVVALAPDNESSHYNLGAACFQMGRLDDAVESYRRALEIAPNSSAYTGLGTVLFFLGRFEESIALFEKATVLTPRDPRVWFNLGDAQRWIPGQKSKSAESIDRAILLLQEQLRTDPESGECWSQLAKSMAKRGRVAESLDAIRHALEISDGNAGVLARAITVYELGGDREKALQYLQRALAVGYGRVEIERDPELEELRQGADAQAILKDAERRGSGREFSTREGGDA